ncbi:MAG: oligosaccharide flippase family protein [Anaerolineaceae bacterium]
MDSFAAFGTSTAIAQVVVMVYMIVLARYLGPDEYGIYVASFSLASLTSIVFNLGLDTWLLREGALSDNLKLSAMNVLRIKTGLGLAWGVLTLLLAPRIRPDLFSYALLAVCLVDVWFDSVFNTLLGALNIKRRIKEYSLLMMFSRGSKLISLLILIASNNRAILWIAGLRAVISLLSTLMAFVILKLDLHAGSKQDGVNIIKASKPYNLSTIFSVIYMQADVNLISLIKGKTAAGFYSPALSLINALFVIPNSVYTFSIPVLSRIYQEDVGKFFRSSRKLLVGIGLLGIALFVVVGIFGDELVRIFLGDPYETTGRLLVLLSPILLLKAFEFGNASIIVALNKQKERLIPQVIAAVANVALNLTFIPRFGVFGAAYAYVISETVIFIGYGIIVFKYLRQLKQEHG